ncbi:MAG: hypothetical protein U0790_22960 [Isosphaeraceae bacterium]
MIDAFDAFWSLLGPKSWGLVTMAGWLLVGLGSLTLLLLRRPGARGPARPFWIALALIGLLAALEMGWPVRYDAIRAVRSLVVEKAGPEFVQGRRPWQAAMVLVTLAAAAGSLGFILRSFRTWPAPARLAAVGLLIALTGYALEFISLHQVDAHYGVYWSLWLGGLATMLSAIAWAGASGLDPRAARRADDGMGSRTYRIPGAGACAVEPRDPAESLGIRLRRVVIIGALLALPEIAAWLSF